MINTDYDVIIVGAGPAGASCAKNLINNGMKTLVIEKRKLPRFKCCSGLITIESQAYINEVFGEIPEHIFCQNKNITLKLSNTDNAFYDVPNTESLNLNRRDFDFWLINAAGAEIIENCTYKSHTVENNIIYVRTLLNNKEKIFQCKYLIGADGGNSAVRKNLDSSFKDVNLIFAYQRIYRANTNLSKNTIYYLTDEKFSCDFAWFNQKDDELFVGTSYYLQYKKNNYYERVLSNLIKYFDINIIDEIRNESAFLDARQTEEKFFFGKDNVFLIGEAAGLLTAVGEGISYALFSGKILAECIMNHNADILNNYKIRTKSLKQKVMNTWITNNYDKYNKDKLKQWEEDLIGF